MEKKTREILDNPVTRTVAFGAGLILGYRMSPRSAAFTGGLIIGYVVGKEASKP